MSESEARMLGVAIDESSANVADSAGGTTKMRTAMVDELAIGGLPLRNVGFLILPDSQQPIRDLRPGERGIIDSGGHRLTIHQLELGWNN
jgi:Aspartyl protease